ncbi:MAG TPA: ubiquinol-cytochrome c reductase iron-sulfur subunit [Verrucomicrobiae bacterium]|nr:ubiquinol-cytochrome c reductase iron-sulfur subunit [Verrucomicrobiae bacterium]
MGTRISRRRFMVLATNLAGAGITLLIAAPIVGEVLQPIFTRRSHPWVRVGDISQVPVGLPTAYVVQMPTTQAWKVPPVARIVYVVKLNVGNQLQVLSLSNVCTHMQCDVHWDIDLQQFLCPCHGGFYSITGTNVGGPPPKPLFRYQHKLAGETLYVRDRLTEA